MASLSSLDSLVVSPRYIGATLLPHQLPLHPGRPRCSISYLHKEINSFYVSPLLSGRTHTPSAARKSLKVHRSQSQFVSTCFARAENKRC